MIERLMIERPSPNHDERQLPVSMLILHYTGMKTADEALGRLTDARAKVSAHYLIAEDGQTFAMVDEDRRAWHAGMSWWRTTTDINSASIGIEIANPGHEWGYAPFPDEQIAALETLMRGILGRHRILRSNIVGHSDIAPRRKADPGELFPWARLAVNGLAVPTPSAEIDPNWYDEGFMAALGRYGYDISWPKEAVIAFQRRFRPANVSGEIDAECRGLLFSLLRHPQAFQ
jgi:N-acetylmuramoyl-L-alanine amidase